MKKREEIFNCCKINKLNYLVVCASKEESKSCLPFSSRILNKLSPEKFDKLSLELLNVGIESQVILKGVILLVSSFHFITVATLFIRPKGRVLL